LEAVAVLVAEEEGLDAAVVGFVRNELFDTNGVDHVVVGDGVEARAVEAPGAVEDVVRIVGRAAELAAAVGVADGEPRRVGSAAGEEPGELADELAGDGAT